MSQERTEALVLRGVDFSETSRIVTFLTPDRGKLVCMAKGVRRPKSQLAGLLDTYNRLEIVYYLKETREVQLLTDASVLHGFSELKRDLDRSTYAALPLEFVLKVAQTNEPLPELYRSLVNGLRGMETWKGDIRTYAAWLLMQLLVLSGYEPQWDACSDCGGDVGASTRFSYSGGVVCGNCPGDRVLSRGGLNTLKALHAKPEHCPPLKSEAETLVTIGQFAERQLEANLKSARVIAQMYG